MSCNVRMRCFSAIKATLATLSLLAALAAQAVPLQWPVGQAAMEQAADAIRYILTGSNGGWVDGERLALPDQVAGFYADRDFRPAWFNRNGIFPEADGLMQVVRQADTEGLAVSDYPVAAIDKLLTGASADPQQLAQLDLLLTDTFLLYSRNAYSGRIDPHALSQDWFIPYHRYDAVAALEQALATHTVGPALAAMPPTHDGYVRLRTALRRYLAVAAQGGWPDIVAGPVLRRGARSVRVMELRRRLSLTGDLPADEAQTATPQLFDTLMLRAVQHFQQRHGIKADGTVGDTTLAALNVPVAARIAQIEINMDRWRWLPRHEPVRFIMVNMAGFYLQVIDHRQPALRMRVIVGRDYRQTPIFSAKMTSLVINPYWYVPPTVFRDDILPRLRQDPNYLQREGLQVFSSLHGDGTEVAPSTIDWSKVDPATFHDILRQQPGPHNALGRIKFMLPNRYGIYLHDTPHRWLFGRTVRAFSSGCIRLEHPIDLAQYVLADPQQWNHDTIDNLIAQGKPVVVPLPQPLPVYLTYMTAWVDQSGTLQLRDDIYGRDQHLLQAWQGNATTVAAKSANGQ